MRYKIKCECIQRNDYNGLQKGEIYYIEPSEILKSTCVLVSGKIVTRIKGKVSRLEKTLIPLNAMKYYFKINRKRYEPLSFI